MENPGKSSALAGKPGLEQLLIDPPPLLFFRNQNLMEEAILKQHVMKHQIYMSAWNHIYSKYIAK